MRSKSVCAVLLTAAGFAGVAGCASTALQPIDSSIFAASPSKDDAIPDQQSTQAVAELKPAPAAEGISMQATNPAPVKGPLASVAPLEAIGVGPTTASSRPATSATTEPVALSSSAAEVTSPQVPVAEPQGDLGVFMTVGGVLARVDNTPIYANQVLRRLDKQFAAKARELDLASFREFAEQGIKDQLEEQITDERIFNNAFQSLNSDDRRLADGIAMQIQHEKVIAAGGSFAEAKRRASEDGLDFDEDMKEEYRKIVQQIYQRRQIEPRIQVTADDMRDFYNVNVSKLYSDKDRAQFRVIEIDPSKIPGPQNQQLAMKKINSIREKASHGEDFAALASATNDSDFLRGRGGNPCDPDGWMERNTYRIDAVEAAVWQLQPGQITPVVESEHHLYIAKLDAKHLGEVKPFDDQAVQRDIFARLHQQQFGELMDRMKYMSFNEATVSRDSKRLEIALDIAMQKYPQWAGR